MPNKSRLNAEMKKQLEDWWMDNDPLDFGQLSAFLATALEEERAKVLSEVEELKQIPDEIPEPVLEPHDEYNWDWRVCKLCGEKNIGDRAYLEHMRRKHGLSKKTTSKYYNQAIDDVLAKLNQLKEGI